MMILSLDTLLQSWFLETTKEWPEVRGEIMLSKNKIKKEKI